VLSEMVTRGNAAKFLVLVTVFATHGTKASIEDVLAGLSTPDLNNLLDDLQYDEGYGAAPEEDMADDYAMDMEPQELKRSVQVPTQQPSDGGTTQPGKSAAAAAMLPAYCDPPNPCPPGYTSADGCIEDFENSSDYSRNFQADQKCICDTEHMFNCPANGAGGDSAGQPNQRKTTDTSFLSDMPGLTADGRENPYFGGQKLPIAAKKGMDF